jgi:hypothetical protein
MSLLAAPLGTLVTAGRSLGLHSCGMRQCNTSAADEQRPPLPNAGPEPRLEAGARHERTLEGVGSRPLLGSHSYLFVRFVAVSDRLLLDGGQERGRSPLPVRRFGACYHLPRRAPDRMVNRHPAW